MIRFDHRRGLWSDQPGPRLCSWLGGPMMAGPSTPAVPPTFVLSSLYGDGGGGTNRTTFPSVVIPLGALAILITSKLGSPPALLNTVSDGKSNTWTIQQTYSADNPSMAVCTAPITAAWDTGTSLNQIWSATGQGNHYILGYVVSPKAVGPLDKLGSAHGTSSTPSATTGTTTQAAEVAIAATGHNSGLAATQAAGWIDLGQTTQFGSGRFIAAYKDLSATGAVTYNPTLGGSTDWTVQIVTIKTA